jgi:hypothetical protein
MLSYGEVVAARQAELRKEAERVRRARRPRRETLRVRAGRWLVAAGRLVGGRELDVAIGGRPPARVAG